MRRTEVRLPEHYHVIMRIIAHGIDVVDVKRIQAMLAAHPARFVERCFTTGERAYADSGGSRSAERYAVRFACKEAVFKALGTGWRNGIAWTDAEVLREPSGQPNLRLTGRCAELAKELGITRWHVSLSHSGGIATASVIAAAD